MTRGIVGNTNNITAAICRVAAGEAADVSSAVAVAQIAAQLP